MKKFIIGIISWLPNDGSRQHRQDRVLKTIETCEQLFKNIPIVIVAQNWQTFTIDKPNVFIKSYKKGLGIVKARQTLQKQLLKYDFDYAIFLDDDAIIYGNNPKAFLKHFDRYNDGYCFRYYKEMSDNLFVRYMPASLNLCVISKNILSQELINLRFDPQKIIAYEDVVYPIMLYCKYPEKEIPYPIGTVYTSFKTGQNIKSTWASVVFGHDYWKVLSQNTAEILDYLKKYKEYPNFKQNRKTKKITIQIKEDL